nr:MAG TPA: hypothetical protein [Caudoviricetes sp.]
MTCYSKWRTKPKKSSRILSAFCSDTVIVAVITCITLPK